MPKGQYDRGAVRRNPFIPDEAASAEETNPLAVSGDLTDTVSEPESPPPIITRRQSIDTAPKNGQEVLLFSDNVRHGVRARWKKTRQFSGGRWRQSEFWSCPVTQKALGASWTEWEPAI